MKSSKNPYIKGSKVPVEYLIDYYKEGFSLTEFLSAYPWVKKESAQKALDEIKRALSSSSSYAI
jgi:uncharacterized protein (DUF433 family)